MTDSGTLHVQTGQGLKYAPSDRLLDYEVPIAAKSVDSPCGY